MSTADTSTIIATLDDGLILRRATPADADALTAFHAGILKEEGEDGPSPYTAAWVRELMSGNHPTFTAGDFTIVETPAGEIVSSLSLISQTWTYDGLPFGAGRIELVSTHPDYRRRGLVRRQMDVVHQWSAERGELIQGITGIPNFYRQFGYEMALDLGNGRFGSVSRVPELGKDETEPFHLRPATAADAPLLASLEDEGRRRWLLTAVRDADHWRYEIEAAMDPRYTVTVAMVANAEGEAVGSVVHFGELSDGRVVTIACELTPGLSWLAVTPSLLRALKARGEAMAQAHESGPVRELYFGLGGDHPLYHVLPERLAQVNRPYAWYLRAPDLPAFLRHVAPVLEARLAASAASGHSGELLLNFYSGGLRIELTDGRLTAIEEWSPPDANSGAAAFPGLSVLQLVFGYRTLAELRHAFADCEVNNDDARVLLEILFPKLPSRVWPID
jgi:RimJ/RimL family protein N-acetyltransferase